jgi:tRNA threonylcarbamoyladenosine biosynthesis protein TsaB
VQLSISTSTAACSVALLDGNRIIAEEHQAVGRGHAEHLIPMIGALPGSGRADLIWVDCGPGSFTGTRVGLAAARALALAWGVPVLGFSSLSLIAVGGISLGGALGIALLAGHGELFVQDFTTDPLAPVSPVQSLSPDAAARFVGSATVLGSGAETLVRARGIGTAHDMLPRAASAGKLPDALRQLPPRAIYVRAPDARAA